MHLFNEDLPQELINIVSYSDEINELGVGLWYSRVVTFNDLILGYSGSPERLEFFRTWNVDKNLNCIEEDLFPTIQSDKTRFLDEPIELKNFKKFIPIIENDGTGEYVLYMLDQADGVGRIVYVGNEGLADTVAPNLEEHFSSLIRVLKEGRFSIDDGDVVAPFLWMDRQRVLAGEAQIDEYGELVLTDI